MTITHSHLSLQVDREHMTKLGYGLLDNVVRLNAREEGTNKIVPIKIKIENINTWLVEDITIDKKEIK